LYAALLCTLKLFAPILPFVTEEIYSGLFAEAEGQPSIHLARWPEAQPAWASEHAEALGERLIELATAVRRYKTETNLSVGAELSRLLLSTPDPTLAEQLTAARLDILSVTRAKDLSIVSDGALNGASEIWRNEGVLTIGLER